MKRMICAGIIVVLMFSQTSTSLAFHVSETGLPAPGNNKVAYYVFDSGGPDHFPLTTFTDKANVVVLFEGTLWELADSVHYSTGWMRNVNYHSYSEIIRDVRILQARGVKVLMNVDDAASWSTSTPFTTYDGIKYDYQQFAAFIKSCAIDSLHLDGISLDVEHGATGNAAYIALLKEIGKYFGPLSSNAASQIYTTAIYSGGAPGYVIGKSRDVAAYFSFVMDMAYFSSKYTTRFSQWADSIGASKTMIGVLNTYFDLTYATSVAAWQPASPPKAGIMVYAANNLKSYTDAVFNALVVAPQAATNPNPANNATNVSTTVILSWSADSSATSHDVYFGTSNPPESKGNQTGTTCNPGALALNTTYYWRIDSRNSAGTTTGTVWSFTTGTSATVRVEGNPEEFALLQNYPNPFNPSTKIGYRVPEAGNRREAIGNSWVRLVVYDLLGREVAVLVDEKKEPGSYEVNFDGARLPSGIYFYRLMADGNTDVKKMVLMR